MARQLIISGFHRSGTSAAAQIVHRAGLFVGDDLLGAKPSNPYGHFEDRAVIKLHKGILADNGLNWMVDQPLVPNIESKRRQAAQEFVARRNEQHLEWGFKDPRACLFLDLWKELLPDVRVLHIFRSAADSTYSLERRHARQMFAGEGPPAVHLRFWNEPDLALRMWITHNEAVLDFAEAHPGDVAAVSFEQISKGFPLPDLVAGLGFDLDLSTGGKTFDAGATTNRRHPMVVTDGQLIDRAMAVWQRLGQLEQTTVPLSWKDTSGATI